MRTQHSLLISLFLLIFLPATAYAEIYKWVDGDGKIQFGDERPLGSESENVKLTINTFANVSFKIADEATKKEVIMYTTSWCGYCKKARRHLEQEKIAYTEYDIEKDPQARSSYLKLGVTRVPVILVGKERMVGFSAARFKRFYGES